MISTTLDGRTVWILPYEPDWRRMELRVEVPSASERGETGAELRGAVGHSLRCRLNWSAILRGADLTGLELGRQQVGAAPVVAPAWPFAVPGAQWTGAEVKGGLVIAWMAGWTSWTLGTSVASPSTWTYVAPALLGFLVTDPELGLRRGDVAQVEFALQEDGPAGYGLLPPTRTWSAGAALADATVPWQFPLRINWATPPNLTPASVVVERQESLPGRVRPATYFPQSAARALQGTLTLVSADIATFLAWWRDCQGRVETHQISGQADLTRVATNASAGATTLTVSSGASLGLHRLIRLVDGAGAEWVRVTAVAGDTMTLLSPLARAWSAGTRIEAALLARHATSDLTIAFRSRQHGEAIVRWKEVPAEVVLAEVETRGETIGARPTRAWLYALTTDWGTVTETVRVTSHERDISASSQTWTSRPGLSHSEIRQSLRLDRDEVTLTLRWWDGCPLEQFLPGRLSALVRLAIYECEVTASGTASNVVQVFGGDLTKATFDGVTVTAAAAGSYAMFGRPALRLRMQRGCNHTLGDPLCGLVLDGDLDFEAVVTAASGLTVEVGTITQTGGLPPGFGFAHWFALGWVTRVIAGRPVRAWILDSAAIDMSGQIVLTLHAPPSPAVVIGEAVTLVPGCDGRPESCKAWHVTDNPEGRFDNYARFGGFPHIPTKAPQFAPVKRSDSASGKK